eukprot:281463-Pelagomonas_calceolata.AAC.2
MSAYEVASALSKKRRCGRGIKAYVGCAVLGAAPRTMDFMASYRGRSMPEGSAEGNVSDQPGSAMIHVKGLNSLKCSYP